MCAQAHWSQSKLHCVVDTKLKVRLSTEAGNYPALGGGPVVSIQCPLTTPSQAVEKRLTS